MFSSSETDELNGASDFCPRRGDGVELRRWSLCKEIRASDNSPFDFRWVFDDVDAKQNGKTVATTWQRGLKGGKLFHGQSTDHCGETIRRE
jgi:hypothetical protein